MQKNMIRKFQRTIEDFSCEKCGFFAKGSGYTNHCPRCLWSKHVDINPGDRLALCGGLMEPKKIETSSGEQTITHQCTLCKYIKKNKVSKDDNFDIILEIMRAGT